MIPAIWSISGDVAITVLGAVFVALFTGVLTAVTTNHRLKEQLAHDRELKDVEELRSLLDDAALQLSDATILIVKAIRLVQQEHRIGEAVATVDQVREKALIATQMEERIALRLGQEDEVTKKYGAVTEVARSVVTHFDDWAWPLSASQADAMIKEAEELEEPYDDFLEASRRYIGSQLGRD